MKLSSSLGFGKRGNNWRKQLGRILVIFIVFLIYRNFTSSKKRDIPNSFYNVIDLSVNTSGYSKEYAKYQDIRRETKPHRDEQNHMIKKIIKDKRDPSGLFKPKYTILVFTKVFNVDAYCNQAPSIVDQCPYKNCEFTCDRTKARSADSVLFHAYDLIREETETKFFLKNFLARIHSRKNQIWLLWNDEPGGLPKSLDKYKFNWTISYPIDSEIAECSYGCTYEKNSTQQARLELERELEHEFRERRAAAAWFVSNCNAEFRNDFALDLKRHFDIRVYGRCRDQFLLNIKNRAQFWFYSLFRSVVDFVSIPFNLIRYFFNINNYRGGGPNEDNGVFECKRNSQCEYEELSKNLFYLSFESKNCSEYITEKLWRILNTRAIPIVIQPNRETYEKFAPKDSFIHAEDFGFNAAQLADYLHLVATDINRYMFHQRWRVSLNVVHSAVKTEERRFCELCTRLNTESDVIYYEKVSEWFSRKCH